MYKSKFYLWIIIGIVAFLIYAYGNDVKEALENTQKTQKHASFSSFDSNININMNGVKIGGTELYISPSESSSDIIIQRGNQSMDGYQSKTFYSPLVAIMSNNSADGMFTDTTPGKSYYVRVMDLDKVIKGFLEEQQFKEFYNDGNYNLKSKVPKICVDEKYEREIKALFIIALAGHADITNEDVEKYGDIAQQVWDKAEKLDNCASFIRQQDLKEEIVLTAEYNIANAGHHSVMQVSFNNTVAIEFTVLYKDNLSHVVTNDNFMKETPQRKTLKLLMLDIFLPVGFVHPPSKYYDDYQ